MTTTMDTLVVELDNQTELELDQIVEGQVISIAKKAVYVDLAPHGTGIIFGREFLNARDILRNTSIGDTVKGKVVEIENEDGYIELSLKEARQVYNWRRSDLPRTRTFQLTIQGAKAQSKRSQSFSESLRDAPLH